jgi:hypothetical protein
MKKYLILILFMAHVNCFSQNKTNGLIIGTNPFSLAEPHTGIGLSLSKNVLKNYEIWTEITYFFNTTYIINNWKNISGYRLIVQPRFFPFKNKGVFVATEFRLKNFSFNNELSFINHITKDTLKKFNANETQKIIGGALLVGKKVYLGEKLFLECTVGFGARIRYVNWKNIPNNYEYLIPRRVGLSFGPREEHFKKDNGESYYMPIGVRVLWQL